MTDASHPSLGGDHAQAVGVFHPGNLDKILDSDPCSIQMQHVEEALATFCAFNHGQLPDTLDQLKDATSDPGLNLNCPVTGQPYLYSRAGLFLPTDPRRIVLWEPTASHHGSRLCLMVPHLEPGHAVTMELRLIPEADFQKAAPAIQ